MCGVPQDLNICWESTISRGNGSMESSVMDDESLHDVPPKRVSSCKSNRSKCKLGGNINEKRF